MPPTRPQRTPTRRRLAYFDTLGRPFLTIADNGGGGQISRSRVELDIQGQPALGDRCARPHGDELRLRHARQPDPSSEHGSGRALDAERRRGQAHSRLGQPRPQLPHRHTMRCAGPLACSSWARTQSTPIRARPQPRSSTKRSTTAKASQRQALNLRTRVFQQHDAAGVVTNMGPIPSPIRTKASTSRAICCAAAADSSRTTRHCPT